MKKRSKKCVALGVLFLSLFFMACGMEEGKEVPTPTATATPTPGPTATPTPIPYEKGAVTETEYASEWIGMRFVAPEGFFMATQEEMDAAMQQGMELMYGDTANAMIDYAQLTTVTEMIATHIYGTNVIVQVEKLSALLSRITEEQYLEILKKNLSATSATSGIVYTFAENVCVTEFAGQEYIKLSVELDYGIGIMLYQDYLVRKVDDRVIGVVFSYREDSVAEFEMLMDAFAPY